MKIVIAAVGKMKISPSKDIIDEYLKKLPWEVTIKEVEDKRLTGEQLKDKEAELLLSAVSSQEVIFALDEHGKHYTSREFALKISKLRDNSQQNVGFIIGGADGLSEKILNNNSIHKISLGKMTWPHMLARILIVEQLYRCHTIMTNHPYHRD